MSDPYFSYSANPRIYAYTDSYYKAKEWVGSRRGCGVLKVGYTQRSVQERIAEQFPTNRPSDWSCEVLLDESAVRRDGTFFKDFDVFKALSAMGVRRLPNTEWFECTPQEVLEAICAVRENRPPCRTARSSFTMRPEQARAVEVTASYFKKNARSKSGKTPHFLWNAKMRFGKTFTAYQLAKKMNWKRILVLTFKPAVQSAWQEDLETHTDFKDWQFISSRTGLKFSDADKSKPIVWFASFQDVLGKTKLGGLKPKNEEIHANNWDCIIFDEYHFGAWRECAKELFDSDELEETSEDAQKDYNEELMPITSDAYLYLSGTPFRAINSGEFLEDQIFNWTYSDEQKAKRDWQSTDGPNPYLELPQMVLLTYQMPEEIRNIALKGEYNEFTLNEFFKAETASGKSVKFKYETYVQKWLDLIRSQYIPAEEASIRMHSTPPMPYSDARLLSASHSLWFLPNVAACQAMKRLLESPANRGFYGDYKVVVCAGIEAGIGLDALTPVREAIGDPFRTKTITLSCGKLTTGVSVPEWSAIFMLRDTTSPETYFQSAFRVQTPWKLKNPTGRNPNEVQIIKEKCYVYDFAPDRALSKIADYAARLDLNSNAKPEDRVADFIHFLPVLCYHGGKMSPLDAGEILDFVVSGTASTMLARRWESALLVNVDNETLRRVMDNDKAMKALENIEGFRNLNTEISTILSKSEALKKIKREKTENRPDTTIRKTVSEEEKKVKSLRKKIQEKLLKFAARIPVFMYLTDNREQTLKDVITQLEPSLFKRVTGLSIQDFNILVGLDVFNSNLMNSAIFAFKRYEDASLCYTGICKHEEKVWGGWDTKATIEEVKSLHDLIH